MPKLQHKYIEYPIKEFIKAVCSEVKSQRAKISLENELRTQVVR